MNVDSNPLDRAQRRLALALDALEAAVRRRQETDRSLAALEAELSVLGDDRSRLAQELDRAQARAARLELTTGTVSKRLDLAVDTIRAILDSDRA
jgi:predicted  nucleic acid-binding Zn-ribbon protein